MFCLFFHPSQGCVGIPVFLSLFPQFLFHSKDFCSLLKCSLWMSEMRILAFIQKQIRTDYATGQCLGRIRNQFI